MKPPMSPQGPGAHRVSWARGLLKLWEGEPSGKGGQRYAGER